MIDLSVPRAGGSRIGGIRFLDNDAGAVSGPGSLRRACSIWRAFKLAGIEFIDENGGGPGVRYASASG